MTTTTTTPLPSTKAMSLFHSVASGYATLAKLVEGDDMELLQQAQQALELAKHVGSWRAGMEFAPHLLATLKRAEGHLALVREGVEQLVVDLDGE